MSNGWPNFAGRLEQAYVDRLDGKITEEFWEAKSAEWQEEEQTLLASLRELERAENPERALDRVGSGNSEPLIPEILSRSVFGSKVCSRLR